MAQRNTLRLLASLSALPLLVGCSPLNPVGAPEAAVWVPHAEVGLATIARSTSYAVQHSPDTDLLIYEVEERFLSGNPATRLSWLIEIPQGAPLEKSLEVGGDRGVAKGWLLEEISGKPSHAAPLAGTITISQRSADALTGVVNVYAVTSQPSAGEASGGRARLARKIDWSRRTRETINGPELETRGGITSEEENTSAAKEPY